VNKETGVQKGERRTGVALAGKSCRRPVGDICASNTHTHTHTHTHADVYM